MKIKKVNLTNNRKYQISEESVEQIIKKLQENIQNKIDLAILSDKEFVEQIQMALQK